MSETQIQANRRSAIDVELGRAASALERAAQEIAALKAGGIEYSTTSEGDLLGYVRAMSRWVLDIQVQVRKENHL